MKTRRRIRWCISFAATAVCLFVFVAQAQLGTFKGGTDFQYPEYYPASNGVRRMKTLLTGAKARPLTNNLIALTRPRIESYRPDGTLEWTAISPECIVNMSTKQVHGGTNIFFRTADDRLYLTGVGFLWQQTNSVLILSNQTFTWIDKQALTNSPGETKDGEMKTPLALSLIATVRLTAAEIEQPPTRAGLTITADINVLYLGTNSVLYSNNVIVIDQPAKPGDPATIMTCDWATGKKNAAGKIEEIVAYEKVKIDQGDNHARGNHAIYTSTNEQMVLTGGFDDQQPRPYLFSSQGTNSGEVIIYDRKNNTLTTKKAITQIPSASLKSATGGTNNTNTARKNIIP